MSNYGYYIALEYEIETKSVIAKNTEASEEAEEDEE